jgi:predicted nucleic acid-binding protein
VNKVLVDTGPLVAWLDRGDGDHARVAAWMAGYDGALISTWPVLTEVCHLLPPYLTGRFMRWVAAGGLIVAELPESAADALAGMMEKYADLPMDLADASLVWLADATDISDVLTLDRKDFGIYRLAGGRPLHNLFDET